MEVHGGRLVAKVLRSRGGQPSLHALRRAPVLDLRRLPRGGDRDRRRAPRAVGGLRRRGVREGDAAGRRRRADRGARGDQRDERHRRARRRTARRSAFSAGGRRSCAGAPARCRRSITFRSSRRWSSRPRRCKEPGRIAEATAAALDLALAAPRGPTFVDYPLDVVFSEAETEIPAAPEPRGAAGRGRRGGGGAAEPAPSGRRSWPAAASTGGVGRRSCGPSPRLLGIPVFLNGLGRGCLPADHELAFSRARGAGLGGADVALVVGVPLDFRLGFGGSFGEDTKLIRLDAAPNALSANRSPRSTWSAMSPRAWRRSARLSGVGGGRTERWLEQLRAVESEKRAAEEAELNDERSPLHPVRVYRELGEVLDRDAIVIGDGGDFVSYAGRFIDTFEPGCWMDPGPFGCLGAGPGQAIGAKLAHPERQVCLLLGDGAFGFAGMEFDTMARHGLPVVGVMGNNGIWALEHHPMQFLYGYSVAAELRPETPYEEMVEALGCEGILVREPDELRPALERAFASGRPTLVNVLTDPEVVYPRKSNLA